MIVSAFDPGKVTGFATYDTETQELRAGEGEPWSVLLSTLDGLTAARDRGVERRVVCEDYVITVSTLKKSRGDSWSLKQIGALELIARLTSSDFTLQTPSEAKSFVTDAKLRAVGWFVSTPGGHRNDACRHLVLHLVKSGLLNPSIFIISSD